MLGKRVLLVEGKDDQHVISNLLVARKEKLQKRVAKGGRIEIWRPGGEHDEEVDQTPAMVIWVECPKEDQESDESGGIDKLLAAIPAWLHESDLERLAIVVDADDEGADRRWEQIRGRLSSTGFGEVPKDLPENGVVELSFRPQTPRSVRLAVWVMPDNHSRGMLEDFVARLIPDNDDMCPIVSRFLSSIPQEKRRFHGQDHAKAWIHSWLAVQNQPGRPMGQAITVGYLCAAGETADRFLNWLDNALIN